MQRRTSTPSRETRDRPDGDALTFVAPRSGVRLDRLLASELGCGRRGARYLIDRGRVRVDGRLARAAAVVDAGQSISVLGDEHAQGATEAAHQTHAPRILWESDELIVLDKPAGVHTHAGRGSPSLAEMLEAKWPDLAAVGDSRVEAGLVHRLDRDTSGVVVAARTRSAYADLRARFAAHRVRKRYLALVAGALGDAVVVDRALARRRARVVPARRRDRALEARSEIVPLETERTWSLVEVAIATGVTHQVRAHLALAGHPVIGDVKYGGPPPPSATRGGQLLHAARVSLDDGRSFTAPAPGDFLRALWLLRRDR